MRQIRSVQALKTFEAAARHLSFKYAAQELCVTATAISHQIKTLEAQLGFVLFKRKVRRIELTDQGYELFNTLRKAFDDIDDTINQIETRSKRDVVTLGHSHFRVVCEAIQSQWNTSSMSAHHSPSARDSNGS